nr:hypothetical protein [Tanacetum cinerariifolium]
MSTQQDISAAGSENRPHMLNKENYVPWSSHLLWYAKSRPNGKLINNSIINGPYVRRMILEPAGSENRPPMLNKENYVPWSSRLLRYAKSRPNGKLIHNSIINGPYVRRMIPEPGDANREVPVKETFHQMIKGSDIGIQEKKAKLFNKWERFTSNDGESIESYYHRFLKLMNDLKRNKHFPEKIASNIKFLKNLQPEWSRHVTIVHQTNDLHTTDYTQLYDFLKYNQKERISSNLRNRQIAQPGMNIGQDRQMQMVGARAEGNAAGHNDLDEIEEVNANCILMANLQQASNIGMTLETHNWSSSAQQELHKIVKDKNFPIVNQVDARVQNFEIQFLKEAAKFVKDFKSLTKEAAESLAKHKALEWEIKHLMRAVFSQDIMFVVQKPSVIDTSNLQTELERTKEHFENCIIKKENEYAKL